MKKALEKKLAGLEKDQLISILRDICKTKETEEQLELILMPSRKSIDRVLRKFEERAENYVCNSFRTKDGTNMMETLDILENAIYHADPNTAAYTIWEIKRITDDYDLCMYDEGENVYELLDYLRTLLEKYPDAYTEEELECYRELIED